LPLEFAQELTLLHHQIFLSLRPQCLLTLYADVDSFHNSDPKWNDALINFLRSYTKAESFLYDFVVSQVVSGTKPSERAATIEAFITVCDYCCQLYNFSAFIWILNGLSSKTLRKLSKTWDEVSPPKLDQFKKMQFHAKDIVNVHTFRERTSEPGDRFVKPCIPPISSYLYNYLQRLSLPNCTDNGLINFSKREGMASLLMDIMKLQKLTYDFEHYADIERYLTFQQRKLNIKVDVVNRCKVVLKEENASETDEEDHFFQYLSPEITSTFVTFANNFLKNHSLFEVQF